jgi:hypothetical protein
MPPMRVLVWNMGKRRGAWDYVRRNGVNIREDNGGEENRGDEEPSPRFPQPLQL